jgi:hypothetical protein
MFCVGGDLAFHIIHFLLGAVKTAEGGVPFSQGLVQLACHFNVLRLLLRLDN